MNMSGAKIIKHLLAKNGPMTTKALAESIPQYKDQLVSKHHMKKRILACLEGDGTLYKQVHRDTATAKPTWRWHFAKAEDMEKHKLLERSA